MNSKIFTDNDGRQVLVLLVENAVSGWPEIQFYYCRNNGTGFVSQHARGYELTESGWEDANEVFSGMTLEEAFYAIPYGWSSLSCAPFAKIFDQIAVIRTADGADQVVQFMVWQPCSGIQVVTERFGCGQSALADAQHFFDGVGEYVAREAVAHVLDSSSIDLALAS